MRNGNPRLLVIGCSQRKRPDPGLLPAIERYDGPAFRVLRKYQRESPASMPKVYILSAEFGLIRSTKPIPDYDTAMNRIQANKLKPKVERGFARLIDSHRGNEIAVCLGKSYRSILPAGGNGKKSELPLRFLEGGLGKRLSALKGWLVGNGKR